MKIFCRETSRVCEYKKITLPGHMFTNREGLLTLFQYHRAVIQIFLPILLHQIQYSRKKASPKLRVEFLSADGMFADPTANKTGSTKQTKLYIYIYIKKNTHPHADHWSRITQTVTKRVLRAERHVWKIRVAGYRWGTLGRITLFEFCYHTPMIWPIILQYGIGHGWSLWTRLVNY